MNELTHESTLGSEVMTPDRAHELASAATGLSDFGESSGDDHQSGLEVVLDSLDREAQVNPDSVDQIYGVIVGALMARLASEAGFARVPGLDDLPVERPIFIVGLARSGTTAIHRLLAADPGHQALEMWLGVSPRPRPPRSEWADDPVFQQLDERLRSGLQGTATGRALHYLSAELPDEDHLLTAQSFRANSFPSLAHVPSYVEWLKTQDWTATMRRHRRNLQLIGSTTPEKRWILKNPGHLPALDGILAAYPDAIIVVMHRDPKQTIPSVASVIQYFQGGTSPMQRGKALGEFQLDMFAHDVEAFRQARKRHHPQHFIDVYYPDFVADSVATVERIYTTFDLPYDDMGRNELADEYERGTTGERAPRHAYSLADFGLSPEQVDERFCDYLAEHPAILRS